MAITWKLRKVLAEKCGVGSATALQALLEKNAGVKLSLQSLTVPLNRTPKAIRFQTMQAVCNATGLKLSEFCEVVPEVMVARPLPKPLYHSRKPAIELGFPSPRDYYGMERLKENKKGNRNR